MSFDPTKAADEIFRDYATDGVPASGTHEPVKSDVRLWGTELETRLNSVAVEVIKAADEAKTSDASLADDDELSFAMEANTKYFVEGEIFFDTAATPDFKWRHAGPASPTLVRIARRHIVPGTTADAGIAVDVAFSASDITVTGSGTTGGWLRFAGIVHNGANAGTFSFQWAQNTSDASATTVRAGSRLRYTKL